MWEAGWDGHSEAQRRRLAHLPLAEKIRWLEAAQELVEQLKRSREAGEEAGTPTPPALPTDPTPRT
jgi:hypothetical protein